MKKISTLSLLLFTILLLAVGCSKDNYTAPKASLSGNIIRAEDDALVPQQTINGGLLQLFQTDLNENPTSINSAFHSDGSYENAMLFDGNYKLVVNGPFFYDDTLRVDVRGATQLDIKVRPYLTLSAEITTVTASSATVTVGVALGANNNAQKIARVGAVIGTTNSLDVNFSSQRFLTNTESQSNVDIVTKQHSYMFTNLTPNTTYYIRGVARTINLGNYYNYAPLITLKTLAN
ncbi:DUF3823 domain-containing protein [Sphingobacterium sp. MYb382]|uniref:DUF3823 domain-containing protein n=1 Tax=Sphingobacterium sp. MYb382 TaxID=2745278 RepID=UPI0030A14E4C